VVACVGLVTNTVEVVVYGPETEPAITPVMVACSTVMPPGYAHYVRLTRLWSVHVPDAGRGARWRRSRHHERGRNQREGNHE